MNPDTPDPERCKHHSGNEALPPALNEKVETATLEVRDIRWRRQGEALCLVHLNPQIRREWAQIDIPRHCGARGLTWRDRDKR